MGGLIAALIILTPGTILFLLFHWATKEWEKEYRMSNSKYSETPLTFEEVRMGTKFYDPSLDMIVEVESIDDIHNVWAHSCYSKTGASMSLGVYCFEKECNLYDEVFEVTV
jgi:hypothetical protein